MSILEILNEIASDAGRLHKLAVIERNKDNKTLKRVFQLAYDPFTQFYIRKIPSYTPNTQPTNVSLEFALDSLNDLATRKYTGHAGIAHLKNLLEVLSADDATVIERVVGKDLRVGCTEGTANKVWPNLVHEYPCMLASVYDEKLVNKLHWPAMAQLKMDGMRFNAIVKDGAVQLRSRNGKLIDLRGHLDNQFLELAAGANIVFDGELVVKQNGKLLDRQTGNGILNKAVKGTISVVEAEMVCATVWDLIDLNDFQRGKGVAPYHTRWNDLCNSMASHEPEDISVVQNFLVQNVDESWQLFEKFLGDGQEGIILKDTHGIWEDKRAKHQIKFKGELDCDLKITGIINGTGKYAGKLGAIQCESADGLIWVDIGSGFNDEQREEYFTPDIIGKIVAVKYNARIINKQGGHSLFLPIFLEIREDKTEADHSSKIK
jgi:ATP-dependent DNA ligase